MKSSYLVFLGLISATLSVFAGLPVPQASAQCVMNDTNIQLSMNGSGKRAEQSNDAKQASNGGCVGNTVNTTNVQTQTGGTDRAIQRRQSTQQLNGSNDSPTGINMDPVKVKTNVQVNVDNPADRLK
jgi:hypothetical protein